MAEYLIIRNIAGDVVGRVYSSPDNLVSNIKRMLEYKNFHYHELFIDDVYIRSNLNGPVLYVIQSE